MANIENGLSIIRSFRRLGGNRSVTTAKVIAIGENHSEDDHPRMIAALLRVVARRGDVVLFEGIEAGREASRESGKKRSEFGVPDNVEAFGWDDIDAHQYSVRLRKRQSQLTEQAKQAVRRGDYRRADELLRRRKVLVSGTDAARSIRNNSLIQILGSMRKRFPRKKVIIIGGENHIVDPEVVHALGQDAYIALSPNTPLRSRHERLARARNRIANL